MTANEYQCSNCGGIFEKTVSDAEADAERLANGWAEVDCAIVCDDCYNEIIAWSKA